MELAVIGRRLCEPLTGVGRYLNRLLYHWGRTDVPFERIVVYVPEEPVGCNAVFRGAVEMRVVPSNLPPIAWENLALAEQLGTANLIFGAYTVPIGRVEDSVVSNLGIYESRPDDFSLAARLRTTPLYWHSARNARLALANSYSTRDDVMNYFGVNRARVAVVHLGVDDEFRPPPRDSPELPEPIRSKYSLPEAPFLLFVGKLSKRRNIPWLIEAFRNVKSSDGLAERLVIVGPGPIDVDRLAIEQGVGSAVSHIPHMPIDDLRFLYQATRGLIHPTLHEGFSLPVVEALACGAPVVTFDHASLECGLREDVVLVEPSVAGLALGIRKLVRTTASDSSRTRAQSVADRFSWANTAGQTMSRLARAAANER